MSRIKIELKEAINLLPDSEDIHTYRNGHIATLIGVTSRKKDFVKRLEIFKDDLELSGDTARALNHGLALKDEY